jgi:X-X-X-Leu-X-X-Gly heptad repeat protein
MKKIIALSLAVILLLSMSLPSFASTTSTPKEEVIYGLLNADGSLKRVDVVNSFAGGSITDYGDYTNLVNLTSKEAIGQTDDLIQVTTTADRFFYQGQLKNPQLPWNFQLVYTLNGKAISAEELAGKSGSLTISLKVSQNKAVKAEFFQAYMLQISMTLDPDLCKQIDAAAATIANAGKNKRLVFTVMPEKEAELTVKADVTNFEMPEIEINAMPYSVQMDLPDSSNLTSGFAPLISGAKEMQVGAEQLSQGISALSSGFTPITAGAGQLSQGLTQWQVQSAPLTQSSAQIQVALAQLAQAMEASSPAFVEAQLGPLAPALLQIQQGLTALNAQYAQFNAGLGQTMAAVEPMKQAATQLHGGLQQATAGFAPLTQGAVGLSSGLGQLHSGIAQIPAKMQAEIDAIMAGFLPKDIETGSFVSDKNSQVSLVQFVIKTAAIEIPAEPEEAVVIVAEKTLWQKILGLFIKE